MVQITFCTRPINTYRVVYTVQFGFFKIVNLFIYILRCQGTFYHIEWVLGLTSRTGLLATILVWRSSWKNNAPRKRRPLRRKITPNHLKSRIFYLKNGKAFHTSSCQQINEILIRQRRKMTPMRWHSYDTFQLSSIDSFLHFEASI